MSTERITINEVGPRDGLQSQARHLSVAERVQLVQALIAAGIAHIEVGSFVSPKAVPQMVNTDQVLAQLQGRQALELSVLVPNEKGYELAVAAGATTIAVVVSATETMNQKNIRMSLVETLATAQRIITLAHQQGVRVQAYLSVAFECPFEGPVNPEVILAQAGQLAAWGADEIVIADTIGAANPAAVRQLMDALVATHGKERLACHFHDTRAMGLANVFAGIESGVRKFDSSLGGLGGCPFAPGAKGNVATEDVVMMCEQMGFTTGIDIARLLKVVALAEELTGHPLGGRAHYWLNSLYK